jgi:dipeptidyl-peptidase-4
VVDHVPFSQAVEDTTYPRAGDPNPTVKLGVVSAAGSAPEWVDLSKYSGADFLIVDVAWSADSKQVVYQVQNREQTWLDLNTSAVAGGTPHTLVSRDDQGVGEQHRVARLAQGRELPLAQ